MKLYAFVIFFITLLLKTSAQNCGQQAGGAVCANNECCSQWGWCGTTSEHCTTGCQSQCRAAAAFESVIKPDQAGGAGGDVASLIPQRLFDSMLKYRNDPRCAGRGFYQYNAFITAARSFRGFGTTGDVTTRKRELAAFLAQTSHETTGGWPTAPDGPYAWGYCFIKERGNPPAYCSSPRFPCAPGKQYYGRGPIQITHNYNYAQAGRAIGVDLINNPDLVSTNPTIAFKTALWFWMTPQGNKPSSHNVIIGRWQPSPADRAANRVPGYGAITNIVNGGLECGHGPDKRVADRIGFYRRYCQILGVNPGANLDCANQRPFT